VEALLISGQEKPDDDSSALVRALHKCLVNEEDGAGFDAAWEAEKERAEVLRKKDPDERTKAEQAEIDAYDKKMKDVADAEKQQAEKDANKTAKDAEAVDADDDQSADTAKDAEAVDADDDQSADTAKGAESVDTEDDQSAEEVHLSDDDDGEDYIDDRDYDYDECEEHCREYPEECKDCRKVAELQRADNAGTIKLTKEQEEYLFKWSQTQFYRDFGYPEGHPKHIPKGQPGHGGKFGAGNEQSAGDDDDQSTEELSDTVDEELTSQDDNVDTIPDDGDYIDADSDDDYESKELSDVVDDGSDMRFMRIEENLQAMLQDFRAKDEMQKSRLYDKLQAAYPATIDQKIEEFIMHEYAKLGGDDDAAEALIASISMLGTEATDVKPSLPPQRQPANAVEKESSAGHPNLPKSDVQWNEGDDPTTINMHKVAREQKRQKAESKLQRQLAKHAKSKAKREAKKKAQNDEQFLQMVWSRAKECPAPGRDCSEDARCRAEVEDMVRQEKEGPDPGASAMMKSLSDCLLAD
jgi:hypothetical protein